MENRLADTASPYLRQHADNPVAWQPWDAEALSIAKNRDVPIFLSIGYSSCHWCHVMEEESFEHPRIAEILNSSFVPIKVDREERPDIDTIYMNVCQMVRGQGGWPLSVWLTPTGKPFEVGTYFPPEPNQGMPGFADILQNIADAWEKPADRKQLEDRAQQWTAALQSTEHQSDVSHDKPTDHRAGLLKSTADRAVNQADKEYGGWGQRQKFPHPGRIELLLSAGTETDGSKYTEIALQALDSMASGGLYDYLGGGFHRYCVDRQWTVPHFEKMLYDNAELIKSYLSGYQVSGEERYATIVRETIKFLQREMQHPAGGFYASLDAESERDGHREEGAFYVWTPSEVESHLDNQIQIELFCDRHGITDSGNFEGSTVLTASQSIGELAKSYNLSPAEVSDHLQHAKETLFTVRSNRPRPARDEKILAGWNGLTISALAEAGLILEEDFTIASQKALEFCRENLWEPETRTLYRRYEGGQVGIPGYLADYAYLGMGAVRLYEVTGHSSILGFALELGRAIRDKFFDADDGTLYFTSIDGESLVARPEDSTDASTPASTGVAIRLLNRLDLLAPDAEFDKLVSTVLSISQSQIQNRPLAHVSMVLAARERDTGLLELTITGDCLPSDFQNELANTYLPFRFIVYRPTTDVAATLTQLGLSTMPPIWVDRSQLNGEPTVYACQSFSCSPPKHDLREALDWAAQYTDTSGSAPI